jgi:hypothetical protein
MSFDGVDRSPLAMRMGVESLAAIVSAVCVSPAVSIVDKAIVSNASGREALLPCLINGVKAFLSNPIYFLKQPSFLLIWGVYGGTYTVANNIEALCERNQQKPMYPKFIGSSCANITLSVLKDKAFARMFGVGDTRPLPLRSYFLFGARDSMTILASFTLPPLIANKLVESHHWNRTTADTFAQLVTPVSMQILSTPLRKLSTAPIYGCTTNTFFIDRSARSGSLQS